MSRAIGHRHFDSDGYVRVYLGRGAPGTYGQSGYALEHRVVMERELGRALLPHESPHHRNGDRADNRPANLELWSRRQPPGQRVEDKVAYARSILGLYGTDEERLRYESDGELLT